MDTTPHPPRDLQPGSVIRLDRLADDMTVITEDHTVATVERVHAGRYLVTTEDGARHYMSARRTVEVVAK